MSRWHEPSCSRPKVQVLGGLPCCMDCFAVASLDDIEVGSGLRGPREPPTDEAGTFNLTWPSSVKYIETEAKREGGHSGSTDAEVPELEPNPSATLESSQAEKDKKSDRKDKRNNLGDGSSTSGQSFIYQPLIYQPLINPNDIRLLELDPGKVDEVLHASFSRANLSSGVATFSAVSYTWADDSGNADLCRPFFVGPFWDVIPITRSCEQVLRSVRPSHWAIQSGTRTLQKLWIDSVCINQVDASERSSQVALMGQIYSTASEVIVYLGPARDGSAMALDAITRSLLRLGCGHATPEETCEYCSKAIRLLLQRPYFRRLWVVQEVVLSKQVSIHCGPSSALWPRAALTDRVKFAAWTRHREPRGGPDDNPDLTRDLISLLLDTRECLCQDPRDKVFALLGLIQGWKGAPIVANYEISVAAVWTGIVGTTRRKPRETNIQRTTASPLFDPIGYPVLPTGIAAYLITNGRAKDTLVHAGIHWDREEGLASWVPDISQLPSVDAWFYTFDLKSEPYLDRAPSPASTLSNPVGGTFACRLSIEPQAPCSIEVHPTNASLHVSAVPICNVRRCFNLDMAKKDCPFLFLKVKGYIRHNLELQPTIHLPNLPVLSRGQVRLPSLPISSLDKKDYMGKVFSDRDCIYWLHGVKGYVILRPDPEPPAFTLVCACDLIMNWASYFEKKSTVARPFTTEEGKLLSGEWNRILRNVEAQVEGAYNTWFAVRPGRDQLLDAAQALYYLYFDDSESENRDSWRNHNGAEHLWSQWKSFDSKLWPLLATARGRRAIIRAFRGVTSRGLKHVSKLFWSFLTASTHEVYVDCEDVAGWPSDHDLVQQLVEWARTTKDLFSMLHQSERFIPKALAQTMPGERLDHAWEFKWTSFMNKEFNFLEVAIVDSVDAMERILDFYGSSPLLSKESSWDWDDVRGRLDARWSFWRCLYEDEWMRNWRLPERWHQPTQDLCEQLLIRLKMRLIGFEVDVHEDIVIQ
ncbi:heterokaryon incompatibility protein [Colletotrichum plurivorum]|uniref:Heterokaryon incompatibility protein n=1 Tax=Colletotrichum plurivorum TaxID=2175906 RepID=A0A8H6K923_9PEZI|nr:heterokaryon incompatibility protein [Colletotrichum plurivorum]